MSWRYSWSALQTTDEVNIFAPIASAADTHDLQASWTSNNDRYKTPAVVKNATDETEYNTYACTVSTNGEHKR